MNYNPPPPGAGASSRHVRNIPLDIVLTLVTCGLWNLVVQYSQMQAINDMIREEKYHFWKWFLLTLVTCGLYHIYHEYIKSQDIEKVFGRQDSSEAVVTLILALFGLSIVADAIQQSHINKYYGDFSL